jgi:hypothetical protein
MGFGTNCNLGVSGIPLKDQGLRRVNPCLLLKTNLVIEEVQVFFSP